MPLKKTRTSSPRFRGIQAGYRSGLEETVADQLRSEGIDPQYEQTVIRYTKPESEHRYTADFRLPNGIIVETKGRFLVEDRKKHLLLKEQHPELDIRFVFTRSATKISKTSKTSYADWCLKYGFRFADKLIPQAWLTENPK